MSLREYYLKILKLPPNAAKRDIKASYRKLAFKFHPDHSKNPEDYERFIEVTEAYEYLVEGKVSKRVKQIVQAFYQEQSKEETNGESEEKNNDPRYRRSMKYTDPEKFYARERARERAMNRTQEKVNHFLTRSWFFAFALSIALACTSLGVLMVIDNFLDEEVMTSEVDYKGFDLTAATHYMLVCGEYHPIDISDFSTIYVGSTVKVYYSPFLKEISKITSTYEGEVNVLYEPRENIFTLFPLLPILLFIPLWNLFYRDESIRYYVLYFYNVFACPIILIYIFSDETRLNHIVYGYLC